VLSSWAVVLVLVAAGGDVAPVPWLEVSAADPRCPGAAEVARAVERELGRAPFAVPEGASAPVRCEIAQDQRAWRADIEVQRAGMVEEAVRRIRVRGNDCRRLLPTLVLTLTLALSTPAAPTSAAPAVVTQIRDPEMPAALIAHTVPEAAPDRWNLSVAAVVSRGGLPELAGGLALGGRRRFGTLTTGLEGRFDGARASQQGAVAVSGWRTSAALVPCVAPAALRGCLVSRVGLLHLNGRGPQASRSVQGLLAELGARLAWQAALAGQPLELQAELALPLMRTRLLADGRPVWRAPAAVLSLGLAVLTGR
jgi:hypothetical protein